MEAALRTLASSRKRSHAFPFAFVGFGFTKQTYPALTSQPETRRFISTLLPPVPQEGFFLRLVASILTRPSPMPPRFSPPPLPPPPRSPSVSTKSMISSRMRVRCFEMSSRWRSLRISPPLSDNVATCDAMLGICDETRRRRSWLPQLLPKLDGDFLWSVDSRCCFVIKVSSRFIRSKCESSHLRRLYSFSESVLSPEWIRLLGRSWLEDHRSDSKIASTRSKQNVYYLYDVL